MTCPICYNKTDDNCCPACGFTSLDLLFLSKQDREIWIKTVVIPYRNKVSCRLIAGWQNYFLLFARRLYGFGRLGNAPADSSLVFISENVMDACCVDGKLLYLTGDGKLHYRDFLSFAPEWPDLKGLNGKVKALYGCACKRTILLELMNGNYALVGYKQNLSPINIIYSESFNTSVEISSWFYNDEQYWGVGPSWEEETTALECEAEKLAKSHPKIKELDRQYGIENVDSDFHFIDRVIDGEISIEITVYDRFVCRPELIDKSFDPCHIDNGLPLLKDTKLLSQAIGIKSWYTYALNNPHCFTLTPAGVLTAYQQKEENWFELFFMENIQAFSASNKNIILLTEDRRLYYGDTDDFLKKKSLEALNELADEKQNDIFIN